MRGLGTTGIVVVILLVAGGLFVAGAPQVVMGWVNQIQGVIQNCNNDPYNNLCTCQSNERKIYVPWTGIPRWHCENVQQLLIDPDSPTFKTDSISFAQSYLSQYCGSVCTDLSCGGNVCGCPPENPQCGSFESTHPTNEANNPCISATWGWGQSGARLVNIECVRVSEWYSDGMPKTGHLPWRMEFFVESATDTPKVQEVYVHSNYCVDPEITTRCTHQSICDYYIGQGYDPSTCVGTLPLDVVPNDYLLMINPLGGSGYQSPI